MGQVGEMNHKITGREDTGCCVCASPSHQYPGKKTPASSLEWTSERHCPLLGRAGVGRAGLQTYQSSLWDVGMSTATSAPHEGDLPSLGTHAGLPLWSFQNIHVVVALLGRKDSSTWSISWVWMTAHLLSSLLPSVWMEKSLCGTWTPSWQLATSPSRWVSLSERDTQ